VKDLPPSSSSVYYKTFSELCQRVEGLKSLSEWSYKIFPERLVIRKQDEHFQLPEVEIIIDDSLGFTVKAFGSFLVKVHELNLKYKRSMRNTTVSMLVNELKSYTLCGGVNPTEITGKLFHHVVPLNQDLTGDEDSEQFPHNGYWMVNECALLMCEQYPVCGACSKYMSSSRHSSEARERRLLKPTHAKAPISKTNPERIKLTLQGQGLRCAELERQLNEMRAELAKRNIEVDHELSTDFCKIINSADDSEITTFHEAVLGAAEKGIF